MCEMKIRKYYIKILAATEIAAGGLVIWWSIHRFYESLDEFYILREMFGIEEFLGLKMFIPLAIAGLICVIGGLIILKKKKWIWVFVGPICVLIAGVYGANVGGPSVLIDPL
jgi:hypothetical protein